MSEYVPRIFDDTHDWFKRINREFQFRESVDLVCRMAPGVVEAASGHTFVMTCVVGEGLVIPAGGHITIEVRESWDTHLGNCFRRGIRTVGNREQINACYGAWTDVGCSNKAVKLVHAASYGRIMDLVDIVVVEGELQAGDEVRIVLGPEDGCLFQAQKYAQVAIFPVAVDLKGDGEYRRAAVYPEVKVIGAFPDRFRIFAPGTIVANAAFEARVLPVDVYSFNPATGYQGTALLASTPDLELPKTVDLDTEMQPLGVTLRVKDHTDRGVHYITAADPNTGLSGRSNPIGVDFVSDNNIYFGELHSQMWHSMGTGTTVEYFERGRDVSGLDFCAPANHYNWRFEVTDEIWHELVDTCNAYNDPRNFVTLVSYEWGGTGGSGHRNVYFRGDTGAFTFWYKKVHKDIQEFWDSLGDQDVLVAPHHLKAGCDWSYRSDRFQRFAEICSKWCISETGGPKSVQSALAMGHRIGLVGGTDSHYGLANQGSYHVNDGNGLACVIAPELTRDGIWQALYDRRCYATTGDRILLHFEMNGHMMGTDLEVDLADVEARVFTMRVAGTAPVDDVAIVRNGEVVFSVQPGDEVWEGEWMDEEGLVSRAFAPTFEEDGSFVYYYLRVTQRNRQQAWSSPIWLTQKG